MTPQEKQNARAINQAAAAQRTAARQAAMTARKVATELRVAANKQRIEDRKGAACDRSYQKCLKSLPAMRQQLRNNCIANPGGPQCNAISQGRYPVCAPCEGAYANCGPLFSSCVEDLLPVRIAEMHARCAMNPGGQDCMNIASWNFPYCPNCGENGWGES